MLYFSSPCYYPLSLWIWSEQNMFSIQCFNKDNPKWSILTTKIRVNGCGKLEMGGKCPDTCKSMPKRNIILTMYQSQITGKNACYAQEQNTYIVIIWWHIAVFFRMQLRLTCCKIVIFDFTFLMCYPQHCLQSYTKEKLYLKRGVGVIIKKVRQNQWSYFK